MDFENKYFKLSINKRKNLNWKYLEKIKDEELYAYNVYQIEGEGKNLFERIDGDKDTIMGLPIKQIKNYFKNYE